MPDAIVVEGLGKKFYRFHTDRSLTFHEALARGFGRRKPAEVFWGLRHVSFRVAPGQMVGVVGNNGAGKSTLLRLVGGVGRPDEGSVKVNGRIGGFLNLRAGFRQDLTGKENIFINGIIAGLTRREVRQRFDSIVAFAEVEELIDSPIRTYSTGMQMRLAFAVAAHTDPEILLIDEVLAVGDLAFRRKCFERLGQFKKQGCTILLVSHDTHQVRQLCDEALWLRDGQVAAYGDPQMVVGKYIAGMTSATRQRTPAAHGAPPRSDGVELRLNENRFGSLELEITAVRLLNREGLPVTQITGGDPLRVEIEFEALKPIDSPILSLAISSEDRQVCFSTNTASEGMGLPRVQGKGKITLLLERVDLSGGQYYITVGAYERKWASAYDYHWQVYSLLVCAKRNDKGVLRPPHYWELGSLRPLKVGQALDTRPNSKPPSGETG
jgi:lipopolysaccharide transport system ATP-binding protein